ncbi:DUF2125 domain-containing protein [Actibacterium sp.]|uniref:DUF2125 domain-containing protein n=1 Tax=Actibacterium sp. TaxID=1872125 RepID=UPI00356218EE
MLNRSTISTVALIAGLVSGQAALADVSAKEVWENITAIAAMSNEQITGDVSQKGRTLTVSNTVFSYAAQGISLTAPIGTLTLTEQKNGTVSISAPATYPMNVVLTPENGKKLTTTVTIVQSGLEVIASGSRESLTYDFSAKAVGASFDGLAAEDGLNEISADAAIAGLAGTYNVTPNGAMMLLKSNLAADALSIDFGAIAPEDQGDGHLKMKVAVTDIQTSTNSTMPEKVDYSDMSALIASGIRSDSSFTYGPATLALDFADNVESGTVDARAAAGSVNFALDAPSMRYGGAQRGVGVTVTSSKMPLPEVSMQIDSSDFQVEMPMIRTDDPVDFKLKTALKGLTISDMIWNLFDPTKQLPRDPANLVVDMTGLANWAVDIFDTAAVEDLDGPVGELHALDVNDLELSIAGASLTGNGAFTFNNADLVTFNGLPAPTGSLNLRLEGGNGLMDKLVAMGLLQSDRVMGLRMMLGMFARPGGGVDTLVSDITVTEDGHVLANGQQLK